MLLLIRYKSNKKTTLYKPCTFFDYSKSRTLDTGPLARLSNFFNRWIFFVLICWLEKLVLDKVKCMCKKLLIYWFARLSKLSKAKNFKRWIFFMLICWLEKLVLDKVKCMCKKLLICWFARLSKLSKAKYFKRWFFWCWSVD